MDKNYYPLALKAGQKQYKEDLARKESAFLPALDEMLTMEQMARKVDLGLVQIPAELIVGTKSVGRTASFASNFMPLAEDGSEFASKWKNLCSSHLEEGIRDPIKAWEYRNRFYVEEGNKRVSVLKFFEAVSIPGLVTRILPEPDGSEETELYYEFLDFYQITKVNFIEFSRKGSYKKFLQLMGREDRSGWDEEVVKKLRTDFFYFRRAFSELGGDKLEITAADAMLQYMSIYGYDAIRGSSHEEIRGVLSKVWQEITLIQEPQPISIIEDPEKDSTPGILSRIIPAIPWPRTVVKVLFLYSRRPEDSNWVSGHEKGRLEVQERLQGRVETETAVCSGEEEAEQVMQKAIEQGVHVIFATASEMLNACLKVAIDHPQTSILNCSLNVSHRYLRTYYPRMYEAKFISGAIAGAMCSNDRIGYINNYPVYGNIAEVNAFARGVQLSNAHARVYLEWADDSSINEKARQLLDQGISLISVRNRSRSDGKEKDLFGLQLVEDHKVTELVSPVWNWGAYYEQILRSILDGSFFGKETKQTKSLNYYWGMSSNVVGIEFSESLPRGIRYLGELIHKAIRMGVCRPFYDPQLDEQGNMQWHNIKATISMEEIIRMDWLEPNIVGSIPTYEQLDEKAKKLVDVIGVRTARKDQDETI
ncbi:MAG: BMP family ABC transporter substrate-binding protein [Parasporobacterium sp.]|nr:BMP family ABC transporter substrate-binding protein [Parasporobacterium sp.]